MFGATHRPPFLHSCSHTGARQSSPLHCEGQVHVSGPVQLPPLPQVVAHTGVVQFASNQPYLHSHVSGATHSPLLAHSWTHKGVWQSAPDQPGLQAQVSGPTQTERFTEEQSTPAAGTGGFVSIRVGYGDEEGYDVGTAEGASVAISNLRREKPANSTMAAPKFNNLAAAVHMGAAQSLPPQPSWHLHFSGPIQIPPFSHG